MEFVVTNVVERTGANDISGFEYYFQCKNGEDIVSLTITTFLEGITQIGNKHDSDKISDEYAGFLPELTVASIIQSNKAKGKNVRIPGEFNPNHIQYQLIGDNDSLGLALLVSTEREGLFELNSKISSEDALKKIESKG